LLVPDQEVPYSEERQEAEDYAEEIQEPEYGEILEQGWRHIFYRYPNLFGLFFNLIKEKV